jgi:8-oxo-dGTP diphosphatase
MALNGIDVRCSAIVFRKGAVLLVRRAHDGIAVWTLPGGTPREGESMAACARRELFEETGVSADPSRVAFVLEAMAPGGSRRRLDIVFLATGLEPGAEPQAREPGVEPHFIPVDQLNELTVLPPVAGHLRGLLHQGVYRYAPYLGNLWRPADSPGTRPGDHADQVPLNC